MRLGGDVLKLDLYNILGVAPDANVPEIRAAYRRRALHSHPDLNRDKLDAAEREMVDLNVAAWVLTDSDLRRQYDQRRGQKSETRSRAWYDRVCYGDTDWVVPPKPVPARALSEELRGLLRRIRLWPARVMLEIAEWSDRLSVRQRTTLTALCLVTALLLIAYARPRSLTRLFESDEVESDVTQVEFPESPPVH